MVDHLEMETHSMDELAEENDDLKDRIAELIESEEKAWQTVDKLRVELETTSRLRIQVAELITERDRAMEDLQRFKCGKHPNAMSKVECTICRTGKHVPA